MAPEWNGCSFAAIILILSLIMILTVTQPAPGGKYQDRPFSSKRRGS
jgi:hypothetical protein